MNYYEHHIGDYDEAASHLTACEDGIYCRLIRKYMATEKPLDLDIDKLKRLVRARTREEKSAVDAVLSEFFSREDDGFHQKTCDEVIARYQAGEPEREVKKANEDNRLKRHREERARLFKVVTDAGEHASWNVPMAELREIVKRITDGSSLDLAKKVIKSATETRMQPLPATAPATLATATQSPDTTPQTPELNTSHLTMATAFPEKAADADLLGDEASPPEPPTCPHLAVLGVWGQIMPDLPQHNPDMWKGTRADHLRARWRETAVLKNWRTHDDGLRYFRKFLTWCRESKFLMGKSATAKDRRPFEFELAWLVNPTNWAKTHEGKFHEQG